MIYSIKNLLSIEECEFLKKNFFEEKKITKNQDDEYEMLGTTTYGFRPSDTFNCYMDILKGKIQEELGIKDGCLENVNTYIREYKSRSFLKKHVDRSDIGITLSICLFSNIDKSWPLYVEYNNNTVSYDTEVGDGILIMGSNKISHWRDKLHCEENQCVLQFFIHWNIIKKTKSLI